MAYTTIDNPTDYFNTVLFTGDGSDNRSITVGFQPDWVWCKQRTDASGGYIVDSVRGNNAALQSTNANAEGTFASMTFASNGITVSGNENLNNENAHNYVVFNWLADNTSGSSNTDGSITSTVSANTTSGFSIVSYTGTGANATIGHGLGVAPSVVITKNRTNGGRNWIYGGDNIGWTKYMIPNLTNAAATANNAWNDTAPTSTVASLGSSTVTNESSASMIAYCFAEKKGYSKFGSFTGNGNADGTFVYTGFKPAWLLVKKSSASGSDWNLHNNKSPGFNVNDNYIAPNSTAAEVTNNSFQIFDLLSNGFKCKGTGTGTNASGETHIYMAFAETPFVTAGTKAAGTAR